MQEQASSRIERISRSIQLALEGVMHTLRTEKNMRFHFIAAFAVLLLGAFFNISGFEFLFLSFAVSFVLVTEMLNTAIERIADNWIKKRFDKKVKIIKDISAGAVFISVVNAALVGYIILLRHFGKNLEGAFEVIKQSPRHITLISFLIVFAAVITVKVIRREKNLLRGGMPSGHTALAFSVWAAISLVTENPLISLLVLVLALLIAKSRVVEKVHSVWEVLAGAAIGTLLTVLVFQIM